jgi:HD-GYP domain-containing protein (c-di-GMP phosphodiesterase class II)
LDVLAAELKTPSRRRSALQTVARREATWDALERFVRELQDGDRGSNQIRRVLETVRAETSADVAFLYPAGSERVTDLVGYLSVPADWFRDFTQQLLDEAPDGPEMFFRTGVVELPGALTASPYSAVLARLRRSRPDWVVALSVDAVRPLQESDLKVLSVICRIFADNTRHAEVYDRLKETLFGLVRCLTASIDAKDPYTCGHSERVARIAVRLGQEVNLPQGQVSDLYLAGLLHDVGKIGIRDNVLCKPGPLTPDEMAHIQEHPVIGDRIVSNVKQLAYLRPGVRNHHERFDGAGYPDGLVGESCPEMARIIAVADSCDAMMSTRRYRPALPAGRVEAIMQEGAGTQWDPRFVEAFMAARHDIFAVCHRGLGQSVYTAVERAAGVEDEGSGRRFGPSLAKS